MLEVPILKTNTNEIKTSTLSEIKSGLPELSKYIDTSHNFYETLGVDLDQASYDPSNKELKFEIKFPKNMQGYENLVHGGSISAVLDGVSGVIALIESSKVGKTVATAELSVKFKKAIIPEEKYICVGKIITENSRLFETSGLLKDSSDNVCAIANTKMFVLKNKE